MPTLTIPASVTKRKQACKSCRQRKKKCDSEHPICSLCRKWGTKCDYTIPAPNIVRNAVPEDVRIETSIRVQSELPRDFDFEVTQVGTPDFMQFPDMDFDFIGTASVNEDVLGEKSIAQSSEESLQHVDTIEGQPHLLDSFLLPPKELLIELLDLFIEYLGHMFPCFHWKSFKVDVRGGVLMKEAPLLLYAICCISAKYHTSSTVKAQEGDWYQQAKFYYELTRQRPYAGLRTIQAVLLLVFHACTVGDFSASWLFLGKAWRQAVVLGMNRMDANHPVVMDFEHPNANSGRQGVFGLETSEGKTAVEREEYRRTLWLLFIMDRTQAWPTGWPNAIVESQFKVDLPVADSVFQAMEPEVETSILRNAAFTRNLTRLISGSTAAKDPLNLFHYLTVAHVLLGRVAELVHSLHDDPTTAEYADECAELDACIIRFRLTIPRQATSVMEAPPADRAYTVWLHVMLNSMAILLHFRCANGVQDPNSTSQFTLAVAAARNIAQIIKDASRISITLLLSAHIASSLYIAACVLVIQWRATGDECLKEEIDLFVLVFDRMDEVFSFLGLKFKCALERDMSRSEMELLTLRDRGFKGLLADCTKWDFVKGEIERRGIHVDLS